MKIVYVTGESYLDHSYTIVSELREKCVLTVYMQAKENTEEIQSWCDKFNAVFVKRRRFRNPLSFFSELKMLLTIKKIKADKIWFNTLTAYQAVLVKILLRNIMVMVHDVELHPAGIDYFSVLSVKLTFLLFKKNISVASFSQAELFKKSYGFEPKRFRLPIINYYTEIGNKADNSKLNTQLLKFFFFGSLEPYKGIETLIEAAEILKNKNLNFRINIYGKIKYNHEQLGSKINKLANVSLNDEFIHYKEVHNLYCENDVLILPYRQVTQCGPLLIGYNELVPSISSNLEGFREYIDDGKSGLLFENTPEDLALKMETIIKNPALISDMKDYIKSVIFKKFSMESLSGEYIEYLKN